MRKPRTYIQVLCVLQKTKMDINLFLNEFVFVFSGVTIVSNLMNL
jgi:hypothetical protein